MMRRFLRSTAFPMAALGILAGLALAVFPATFAWAQTNIGADHDASQPIEITADSLEIHRDQSIAIFRGNVDAVQGELHLRARVLTVHYYEDGAGPEGASISRIEAEGDVFVSSPGETAQGKTGVYNVEDSTINLDGSVVLTRGENVIRGDHLVMNLETDFSRIVGPVDSSGSDERVRSVFVPGGD